MKLFVILFVITCTLPVTCAAQQVRYERRGTTHTKMPNTLMKVGERKFEWVDGSLRVLRIEADTVIPVPHTACVVAANKKDTSSIYIYGLSFGGDTYPYLQKCPEVRRQVYAAIALIQSSSGLNYSTSPGMYYPRDTVNQRKWPTDYIKETIKYIKEVYQLKP